jgi:hypothetical protein
MVVAPGAVQVSASSGLFHRECYEAWYFGRHGRRPRLRAGGQAYRYMATDGAAPEPEARASIRRPGVASARPPAL